uniref:BBSome-interacting protein 1 n=1 Tax=Elaeophora elaphi TaxID=1147741 RepID=A0A0R3S284_9BILA
MDSELKEILNARNGLLFCEEELSPVFCKPKLIPLKSLTLEKLEKMQNEAMEMMKKMEESKNKTPTEENTENSPSKSEDNAADIWIADTNQKTTSKTAT